VKAACFRRKPYHHPDRAATRKATAARERMLRAIIAFNNLSAGEQRLFAGRLFDIMRAGEPVPPFGGLQEEAENWAAIALLPELRAYLAATWRVLPERARCAFLAWATVQGRGAAA
jgi:hypothetical protein